MRDPLSGKLPVTLITGFLGSGKTTLISRLLKHPDMNRVAVVINEIGEIGIDHDLVTMSSENVSLLANGCLCCTVRTDLQETLRELFGQRNLFFGFGLLLQQRGTIDRVDQCDDTIEAVLGGQHGVAHQGLHYGCGVGQTGGLDNHAVEIGDLPGASLAK